MALDVWKEVSGVESMLATLLVPKFSDCTIPSRSFVFLGRPDPPRRYTLPSVIHCCQHRATTISLRPRWRPISIRPTCFSENPYQSPSAARTARLRLRGILNLISSIKVIRFVWIAVRRSYSCFKLSQLRN
ncbi:hypothetical protein TNCV_246001 [Trichonephila clavipes]|nr:hypothetical protein TNCV_246001 [Trichonephila clavipes]